MMKDQTLPRLDWAELFFRHVYLIAQMSKDCRTKIGCILVRDNEIISQGFNSFPRGINDNIKERQIRPLKYHFFCHAENSACLNCARKGISSLGAIAYSNGISCSACTISLIQSGIKSFYYHKQWHEESGMLDNLKWKESCEASLKMFDEAKIPVYAFDKKLGVLGLCDGKIVEV
jgi:dCMP deaminase